MNTRETANTLFFIRHGENLANLTLEFSHRKVDYSLTEKGILQARQTADALCDQNIDAIYSSPLKRAFETAQIIAAPLGLPVQILEQFREVNVGDLEGQKPTRALWQQHDAVIAAWQNDHPEVRFPGGEDYPSLLARMHSGLQTVLAGAQGRRRIIVGHGGIFTFSLRGLCADLDPAVLQQGMPNCAITELRGGLVDGEVRLHLVRFASTTHLHGEAARLALGAPGADDFSSAD